MGILEMIPSPGLIARVDVRGKGLGLRVRCGLSLCAVNCPQRIYGGRESSQASDFAV